jgi:hypothetical protein
MNGRDLLALAWLALVGCSPSNTPAPSPQPEVSEPPVVKPIEAVEPIEVVEPIKPRETIPSETIEPQPVIDPQFSETLLRAAKSYRDWGRVDERPDLAPLDCRSPTWFPSHVRLSKADDAQHGRKLYYLFAGLFAGLDATSARDQYTSLGTTAAATIPTGLTIVKQSWAATPSKHRPAVPKGVGDISNDPPPPITAVEHEGQWLEVDEQAELFVMAKVGAPDMPGTDAGWIYGTLSADGLTVTSAGLVQNCMDCHEAAPHERLFGLQKTKTIVHVDSPWLDKRPDTLGLEP